MSRSKRDQTMKFGQVIGYTNRNIFLENHAENETGRDPSRLLWAPCPKLN